MARKKAAKADASKADATPQAEAPKAAEAMTLESPISTTGAVPVYRADMGEALPPQSHLLNPDRAK